VDDSRSGALTAAGLPCGSCGTELPPNSKFCNECGAPITQVSRSAEYKQVTVLFADVVRSMDLAGAVGAERLREIMADLADRCAAVVERYGGTVDKFTGDGIMAVFRAPVALEDHAIRACLAALGIQEETARLAAEVKDRDGIDLQLRVGLNSGQVIAGEIGTAATGYTAIGEQVGLAQRMESVAPPGTVMLSASTARLVDGAATLGESELVQIKGADAPVPAGLRRPTSVAASCNQRRGASGSFHTKRRPGVCPATWPRRPRAQRRSRPQRATHSRR
jgi:adenylate cyclase